MQAGGTGNEGPQRRPGRSVLPACASGAGTTTALTAGDATWPESEGGVAVLNKQVWRPMEMVPAPAPVLELPPQPAGAVAAVRQILIHHYHYHRCVLTLTLAPL